MARSLSPHVCRTVSRPCCFSRLAEHLADPTKRADQTDFAQLVRQLLIGERSSLRSCSDHSPRSLPMHELRMAAQVSISHVGASGSRLWRSCASHEAVAVALSSGSRGSCRRMRCARLPPLPCPCVQCLAVGGLDLASRRSVSGSGVFVRPGSPDAAAGDARRHAAPAAVRTHLDSEPQEQPNISRYRAI